MIWGDLRSFARGRETGPVGVAGLLEWAFGADYQFWYAMRSVYCVMARDALGVPRRRSREVTCRPAAANGCLPGAKVLDGG